MGRVDMGTLAKPIDRTTGNFSGRQGLNC